MSIISTFELLAKRIGPPTAPNFPGGVTPFRKLLQGYYLTIANPNNRNISLRMQAIFPRLKTGFQPSTFSPAERELFNSNGTVNHFYAYDRTGSSGNSAAPREILSSLSAFTSNTTSRTFQTRTFGLQAFQTGLLNVVPNPVAISQSNPQIEVRGYTKIVQVESVRIIRLSNGTFQFEFVKPPPVNLVFTPEIRGTFLDDDFSPPNPIVGEIDFDQSNYALPTSTGAALIKITESVNPFLIPVSTPGLSPDVTFDLGEEIDLKKLRGRLNYMKEFVLDDASLKYIDSKLKKMKVENLDLRTVKTQLETSINQLKIGTITKKGK